jgi:hypothetical protein
MEEVGDNSWGTISHHQRSEEWRTGEHEEAVKGSFHRTGVGIIRQCLNLDGHFERYIVGGWKLDKE